MTGRLVLAALCVIAPWAPATPQVPLQPSGASHRTQLVRDAHGLRPQAADLTADLDRIFDDPVLARALMAVRVERLGDPSSGTANAVLYDRNAERLVVPASNMKIVTVAVAAETLGWTYRYQTRLEARGRISGGILAGDSIVTGTGDPSIGSPDGGHAFLFLQWADAVHRAGIHRVEGRIIGDDNAFDDDVLGAGWAWDYLAAGYAAPVGALNYNGNAAVARILPAAAPGGPARFEIGPPGHELQARGDIDTGATGSAAAVTLLRAPGTPALTILGSVPPGAPVLRTAAVENPTQFFVEALRLALAARGIDATGGAWDVDEVADPPPGDGRRLIAFHDSAPFSSLAGYAMKESQNMYAEAFLKTIGRRDGEPGTAERGRQVVRRTLAAWGIPADSIVMYDGSGLSRYNYVTAAALVRILTHVWTTEPLRGPFVAELPVAGRDGSLELRMRGTVLDRNVQAKTGTINNVRALSGYMETAGGEKLVFSAIANHYTGKNAEVDAVVERALARLARQDDAER